MRTNEKPLVFTLATADSPYNSSSINISSCFGYSIHARWTRTVAVLAGTIKTQKSNDGANWIDVGSAVIADAATGHQEFEVADAMYQFVRVVVILTSGTASFSIDTNIKGV
jgi:hypothetical protein